MKQLIPVLSFLMLTAQTAHTCDASPAISRPGGSIIHVDANAPDGGDGTSWALAYRSLQDAIEEAPFGQNEFWVVEGTYHPDDGREIELGDIHARFEIAAGWRIYGGFDGTEDSLDQRDVIEHTTILSGDIGILGDDSDNSVRIMTVQGDNSVETIVDGFTLAEGRNPSRGAAMKCSGDTIVRNCSFENNASGLDSGAVFANGDSYFENCHFVSNSAARAGAVYASNGIFQSCYFSDNHATATTNGPAGAAEASTFYDCHFENNSATEGGAIGIADDLFVYRCTFIGNSATEHGGAIGAFGSTLRETIISGCEFEGNLAGIGGGAVANTRNGTIVVANSGFFGNSAVWGGAIGGRADAVYMNCVMVGNHASANGGAVRHYFESLEVSLCTIARNTSTSYPAGVLAESDLIMENTILWQNQRNSTIDEDAQFVGEGALSIHFCNVSDWSGDHGGPSNNGLNPQFTDVDGLDDIVGTLDDDVTLQPGSPSIDSGSNPRIPDDLADLDEDGVENEPVPFDIESFDRRSDDPDTVDTGAGESPLVDRGAHEFQGDFTPPAGLYVGPDGGSWFEASHWYGGRIPDGASEVVISGHVLIDAHGAVASSIDVESDGHIEIGDGSLTVADGAISIAPGGTMTLASIHAVLEAHEILAAPDSTVHWDGGSIALLNGGLWDTGGESMSIGCMNSAALSLQGGARVIASSIEICSVGTLAGNGVIEALLTNSGVVAPGSSAGVITVEGDYVQGPGGSLICEVGGEMPGFNLDQLLVQGIAVLDGTLQVLTLPKLEPQLGGDYRIIVCQDFSGEFAFVELPSLDDFTFLVRYGPDLTDTSASIIQLLGVSTEPGPRIYVNASASYGGLGNTWESAGSSLARALQVAREFPGVILEVWVATGTYTPEIVEGDRDASFGLIENLVVYGGFAGTETELAQRDIVANPTILSGDLQDNDVLDGPWNDPSYAENSYHVVTAKNVIGLAGLDGCTIADGHANGIGNRANGGGLFSTGSACAFTGCKFLSNRAYDDGGAAYFEDGSSTFTACHFLDNRVGGAVTAVSQSSTYTDCVFNNNYGYRGAALFHPSECDVTIERCDFTQNVAEEDAGAIYSYLSEIEIIDSTFIENQVDDFSGDETGAVQSADCTVVVLNSLFQSNTSKLDSGAVNNSGGTAHFEMCTFRLNSAGENGGAMTNDNGADVTCVDCVFEENSCLLDGGAMKNHEAISVHLVNCVFEGNSCDGNGGAIHGLGSHMNVDNCAIEGNSAAVAGGGVGLDRGSITFAHGTIINNSAPFGSAIYNAAGDVSGGTTITADGEFLSGGTLMPGLSDAPMNVLGIYRQTFIQNAEFRVPGIDVTLAGSEPGVGFGVLAADSADCSGAIHVTLGEGYVPADGDQYEVVQADTLIHAFDLARLVNAPEDLRMNVFFGAQSGVTLQFKDAPPSVTFEHALSSPQGFTVSDTAFGDIDQDGDTDAVVLLNPEGPGLIVVLRNLGTDKNGDWLGFEELAPVPTVGSLPAHLTLGRFDNNESLDIAVTDRTAGFGALTTYTNDGSGVFTLDVQLDLKAGLSRMASGQVFGNTLDDLVVGEFYDSENIILLKNDGAGGFSIAYEFTQKESTFPEIQLGDMNGDGFEDLLTFGGGVQVYEFDEVAEEFLLAVEYQTGTNGHDLAVEDLNNDGSMDVLSISSTESLLSILMNRGDGSGMLQQAALLPVAERPFSIGTIDAEGDGDRDVLIVSRPLNGEPSIQIYRNDLDQGDIAVINEGVTIVTEGDVRFAAGGFLNGDDAEDMLVVSGDGAVGLGSGSLNAYLSVDKTSVCVGDINGDRVIDVSDLLALLGAWGPCTCDEDVNGDAVVNVEDLLLVLAGWGECESQ